MKIQFASDLHLEFTSNSSFLEENPLEVTGDILLLAGDTDYLLNGEYQDHPFWNWASENYKQVICWAITNFICILTLLKFQTDTKQISNIMSVHITTK